MGWGRADVQRRVLSVETGKGAAAMPEVGSTVVCKVGAAPRADRGGRASCES